MHPYRKETEGRVDITQHEAASPFSPLVRFLFGANVVYAQNRLGRQLFPSILVHVENLGDVARKDGGWCGTRGESRRLEGFSIRLPRDIGDVRVTYRCHLQNSGDTPWLDEGQFCGTRGKSLRLEGFEVRLQGSAKSRFSIVYQAHLQDSGDTGMFRDGEYAGTRGQSRRVEAMRVWLEQR